MSELRVDLYSDGGVEPEYAVRVTHLPSGTIVVKHGKSQTAVREQAMVELSRLLREDAR